MGTSLRSRYGYALDGGIDGSIVNESHPFFHFRDFQESLLPVYFDVFICHVRGIGLPGAPRFEPRVPDVPFGSSVLSVPYIIEKVLVRPIQLPSRLL